MNMVHKSLSEIVLKIFKDRPKSTFNSRDLFEIVRKYNVRCTKQAIIDILTDLYRNQKIQRTPAQLSRGYYYSLDNSSLKKVYQKYLLPYDFENKDILIKELVKCDFEKLRDNSSLNINNFCQFNFYKDNNLLFSSKGFLPFLAIIMGFTMCDGCIHKNGHGIEFYFRQEKDATDFMADFNKKLGELQLNLRKDSRGGSYIVSIVNGTKIIKFLCEIGSPKGNKNKQAYLVPDWILNGPNEVKKSFLSTVIGNEGSAPSNNKWRIQFVLSKSEDQVPNLLDFLNQIRSMLSYFKINTTHIQLRTQPGRSFNGRFYIKGKENLHKFYKQFRFLYASEKQLVLDELIQKDCNA